MCLDDALLDLLCLAHAARELESDAEESVYGRPRQLVVGEAVEENSLHEPVVRDVEKVCKRRVKRPKP